ncbi:Uncharacterized protein dnm_021330 [Desulfonema magnum]|uniref:Uncharacterized protein n=1 Tax=Desulfonema magnum TaxID=45655 RepID=A0A975GLZ7_9BACT|nr:Uncharacterized protein dnm_021330 [Desulfonema magnum]
MTLSYNGYDLPLIKKHESILTSGTSGTLAHFRHFRHL